MISRRGFFGVLAAPFVAAMALKRKPEAKPIEWVSMPDLRSRHGRITKVSVGQTDGRIVTYEIKPMRIRGDDEITISFN